MEVYIYMCKSDMPTVINLMRVYELHKVLRCKKDTIKVSNNFLLWLPVYFV